MGRKGISSLGVGHSLLHSRGAPVQSLALALLQAPLGCLHQAPLSSRHLTSCTTCRKHKDILHSACCNAMMHVMMMIVPRQLIRMHPISSV